MSATLENEGDPSSTPVYADDGRLDRRLESPASKSTSIFAVSRLRFLPSISASGSQTSLPKSSSRAPAHRPLCAWRPGCCSSLITKVVSDGLAEPDP